MNILWYHPLQHEKEWFEGIRDYFPNARIIKWHPGEYVQADYALVRSPPVELLLSQKKLRGIINLGAGVNEIINLLNLYPGIVPLTVPIVRFDYRGIGEQMKEYVLFHVLKWFRRFDDYELIKNKMSWCALERNSKKEFIISIMGAGVIGAQVAECLVSFGFSVRSWSKNPKVINGVECFFGTSQLSSFLKNTRVLVNLLPETNETVSVVNNQLLEQLQSNSYFINVGRGNHVVESDLLYALNSGRLKAVALDVFKKEPLSSDHVFWRHPKISVTPHIAAGTILSEALDFIRDAICSIESNRTPIGIVDRSRGY